MLGENMTPETKLQQQMQDYIKRTYPGSFVMKIHGNRFQKVGVPDLYVIINGVSMHIEVKCDYNKTSPVQDAVIREIKQAGGNACVVYNLKELEDKIYEYITKV